MPSAIRGIISVFAPSADAPSSWPFRGVSSVCVGSLPFASVANRMSREMSHAGRGSLDVLYHCFEEGPK